MIITDRFVFLHLHKSGGTFVNEWLLRFFPAARAVGYHLPRRLIPRVSAKLPVVGLVRNPWSYYVSWYSFQSSMERPNPLFRILSDDRRLEFEGTIRNMLELGSGGERLDALLAALPPFYANRGLNLPGPELAPIRDTGLGFYSFLYHYMYSGDGPAHVARMERMRQELPPILSSLGATITRAAANDFAAAPATNTSAHRRYSDYYGSELRDLVSERDGEIIADYSYRYGD
jgi:hypothetical protein